MKKNPIVRKVFQDLLPSGGIDSKLEYIRKNIMLPKDNLYFDYAASALAFLPIEKRIASLLPYYSNTHSSSNTHAILMDEICNISKERLRKYLKLSSDYSLICNFPNASGAIKRAQEIIGVYITPKLKQTLKLKDIAVCLNSGYEHHSNEISWRNSLAKSIQVPLDNKRFSLANLQKEIVALNDYKGLKIGAFSVASNVTGQLSPYEDISKLLKDNSFIRVFDMAASSSHMSIDCNLYDFGIFATHKLLGGVSSSSLLAFNSSFYDTSLPPSFAGGGAIKYSNAFSQEYFDDIQRREEAGSIDAIGLLKSALSFQILDEVGLTYIQRKENVLKEIIIYELEKIPTAKIYSKDLNDNLCFISVNFASISPYELSYMLSRDYNIFTRAGCSCAGSYGHALLDLNAKSLDELDSKPGWLRISPHFSASLQDIYRLIDALKACITKLRGG